MAVNGDTAFGCGISLERQFRRWSSASRSPTMLKLSFPTVKEMLSRTVFSESLVTIIDNFSLLLDRFQ
jgi:hypothetical protein